MDRGYSLGREKNLTKVSAGQLALPIGDETFLLLFHKILNTSIETEQVIGRNFSRLIDDGTPERHFLREPADEETKRVVSLATITSSTKGCCQDSNEAFDGQVK